MKKPSFLSKETKTAPTVRELAKEVRELTEELAETKEELAAFQKAMRKAVSKVEVLRFNPFNEIGGDQSFSAALLDEENTGVVITSHYGRDMNRVYAKVIVKGRSEHTLAEEEKDVLEKAVNQKNDRGNT